MLAQRASALICPGERPVVTDVGCGEGAFLRALKRLQPAATLQGIDFCPAMLAEARRRSVGQNVVYDLE